VALAVAVAPQLGAEVAMVLMDVAAVVAAVVPQAATAATVDQALLLLEPSDVAR
jgi:hypothetical protein